MAQTPQYKPQGEAKSGLIFMVHSFGIPVRVSGFSDGSASLPIAAVVPSPHAACFGWRAMFSS
jgi:hypothetical protein